MTEVAFNGDAALADIYVKRAEHHYKADMLLAGTYGEGDGEQFKGCSVGCFANDIGEYEEQHEALAKHYTLPEWLFRLQDSMFEGLPKGEREPFHFELAKRVAACNGRSIDRVQHMIAVDRSNRMLANQRSVDLSAMPDYVSSAINKVIDAIVVSMRLHEAMAAGDSCAAESAARSAAESAWSEALSARSAARSAAESAWSAWSAARSARSAASSAAESAWSAAESAWSAAWSAWSAAWSAARSAASSAAESAWSAAWISERDSLFSALEAIASEQQDKAA